MTKPGFDAEKFKAYATAVGLDVNKFEKDEMNDKKS